MKPNYTLYDFIFLLGITGLIQCNIYSEAEMIYNNITKGRYMNIRPVLNQSYPVQVYVRLFLFYIQEFDEVKGKLGITALVYVQWRDETVSWNPSKSKIYSLTYMNDPVWKPEKLDCDGEVTVTECYEVIGNMKLNKPPGLDGLTIELYRAFWGK
jgi:hypothetical protein